MFEACLIQATNILTKHQIIDHLEYIVQTDAHTLVKQMGGICRQFNTYRKYEGSV